MSSSRGGTACQSRIFSANEPASARLALQSAPHSLYRIVDTGRDPLPIMKESLQLLSSMPSAELLWASVREVLNIFQAAECGCHIVTVPHDILAKAIKLGGSDLGELSLDTVRMFYQDAVAAGFQL